MDESRRASGTDSLGVVVDALARADETLELASLYLDPSLVEMLSIIGYDRQFGSGEGSHLDDTYVDPGRRGPRWSLRETLPRSDGCLRGSCVAESSDQFEYRVECGFEVDGALAAAGQTE